MMTEELRKLLMKPYAPVPDVGRICFGLSRNASYAAAHRNEIPCRKIGGRLVALTAPLPKLLGIEVKSDGH
jgi:hypothetical protein